MSFPALAADLGMAKSARQESLGDAFLLALAGVAGCAISNRRPDNDSIDWTLSCRLRSRPKIDVQIKTWVGNDRAGPNLRYPLKIKNYNDLVLTDLMVPRILIVVALPREDIKWSYCRPEALSLRQSAYWVSIRGLPSIIGQDTVTTRLPRSNLLTADVIQNMMLRVDGGAPL